MKRSPSIRFGHFLSPWRTRATTVLKESFGIDVRSLALFRIALGLLILWNLVGLWPDVAAFYSDQGLLSRATLLDHLRSPWIVSVHLMSGSATVQKALIVLQVLAALALIAGFKTRTATIVSWFLLVSLQRRNNVILGGGDDYLRMLLFWSMFVPLGLYASADRALDQTEQKYPNRIASWGTAALLLQTAVVYWTTAAHKYRAPAWHDGSAVYWTFQIESFAKPASQWLLLFPALASFLTHAVLWFEIIGPFLILAPWPRLRTVAVSLFLAMHAGFYSCMFLELFPRVSTVALIAFVPGWFWNRIPLPFRPVWKKYSGALSEASVRVFNVGSRTLGIAVGEGIRWREGLLQRAIVAVMGGAILLMVVSLFTPAVNAWRDRVTPLLSMTHTAQYWRMFANPVIPGGWLVVAGQLRDGRQINLLKDGTPLTWGRPDDILAGFPRERWREFSMNFCLNVNQNLWKSFTRYWETSWNASHPLSERIDRVDVYMMARDAGVARDVFTYRRTLLARHYAPTLGKPPYINAAWTAPFRASAPDVPESRRAAVAGPYYPSDPRHLERLVDECFRKANTPNLSPSPVIIVPHAGIEYSGATAAAAYKTLGKNWTSVILLGPSHKRSIMGASVWSRGHFETPLGAVRVNEELAAELLALGDPFVRDAIPHLKEHCLEVQLPLLHQIRPDVKIVPVLFNSDDPLMVERVGRAIASVARRHHVPIVVTSDLSHYPSRSFIRDIDDTTLRALTSAEPESFYAVARVLPRWKSLGLTTVACGKGAILAGLSAARALGSPYPVQVAYANSVGKSSGDRNVGYAALAFQATRPQGWKDRLSRDAERQLKRDAELAFKLGQAKKPWKYEPLRAPAELNVPAGATILTRDGRPFGLVGRWHPLRESVRLSANLAGKSEPSKTWTQLSPSICIQKGTTALRGPQDLKLNEALVVLAGRASRTLYPAETAETPEQRFERGCALLGRPSRCWEKPGLDALSFEFRCTGPESR